jgi:hypothetical protein
VHPLGHFNCVNFKLPTEALPSSSQNRGSGEPSAGYRQHAGPGLLPPPLSLSSDYKSQRWWKMSPLHRFFLPVEVSSVVSSPPASHRATGPFFNSFGGFTPLTHVLLMPQFAGSSDKDFGLHRTSHRRPPLEASEFLLLCSPPPIRHCLMSVVVLCRSGANVGASSPT